MSDSDDPLFQPLQAAFNSGADCPPLDSLVQLATDELDPREALTVRSHVLECPRCRAESELAHTLLIEIEENPPGDADAKHESALAAHLAQSQERSTARSKRGTGGAIRHGWLRRSLRFAAAAALLISVGWGANRLLSPTLPPLDPASTTRSTQIQVITPVGIVDPALSAFQWEPVEGALTYHLQVERVDETIVFETTTRSPRYSLDSARTSELSTHTLYNWSVKALDSEAREIARSTASFSIEPSH